MNEFKITMAAARVNAGKTQREVAEIMHVSPQTIVNWENNKISPKPAQLKMFCDICQVPVGLIFLPSDSTLS